MTLTHPDQYAKIAQTETDGPMFPKGPKQMLGFIYAMEGEVSRKKTFHARMIEIRGMIGEGYIAPFSVEGINLSGMSPEEINGECAIRRAQVEELLNGSIEMWAVLAKFGRYDIKKTHKAAFVLARVVQDILTSGRRRAQRSKEYCADVVGNVMCSAPAYAKHFTLSAISENHGVYHSFVFRDCDTVDKYFRPILSTAYKKIEKKFGKS